MATFNANAATAAAPAAGEPIVSGVPWRDTAGATIEAHGGGMLLFDGVYYWYGENHQRGVGNKIGVSCYSSRDLSHWKNEGVALPKAALPEAYRDSGVCERPKVIYNAATRTFVMWMHLDAEDYTHAAAGVATAESPCGPFRFQREFRPIAYDYGAGTDERAQRLAERTKGNAFRDMNLFVDDDGAGYVIYASENNATLYLCRLNDDYTDIVRPAELGRTWTRVLPNHWREAPALFKCRGKYFLISSGVTGWAPNAAEYAVAENLFGPWRIAGNPCVGHEADKTFQAQSTFVLPAPGKKESAFIFMADRWVADALERSSYVWLPFEVGAHGEIAIECYDHWSLDAFTADETPLAAPSVSIDRGNPRRLTWAHVPGAAGYRIVLDGKPWRFTADDAWSAPELVPGVPREFRVEAVKVNGVTSPPSNSVMISNDAAQAVFLDEVAEDDYEQSWGVIGRNHAGGTIAGRTFARGVGTHARSRIRYGLGGRYARFTAWVGRAVAKPDGRVQFRVYGDGRLLYLGDTMDGESPARFVDVSVAGVFTLELVASEADDGDAYDDVLWAEAKLQPVAR